MKWKDFSILLFLTAGAFLIIGYHPAVEDCEIYVPGIKKILNPSLYPFGGEFFESHARMTLYHRLVAASVRFSHLSLDRTMLLWHVLSIFLVLFACWKLATLCFEDARARWAGVILVAALLSIPVAGTALYVIDQYLNPRALALFAALFAVGATLRRRYVVGAIWIVLAATVHPLMSAFGASLAATIIFLRDFIDVRAMDKNRVAAQAVSAALSIPLGISLRHPSATYREVLDMPNYYYFFLLRWHWYEWVGIFAPMLLVWWLGRLAHKRQMNNAALLCRALIIYQLTYFVIALITTIPPSLLAFVRYQPMRSLQLFYVFLFLIGGGFLGQYVLRDRAWRWLGLFVPLSLGMFYGQLQTFPATPHIEWPGRVPQNDWLQAFAWIRYNTPVNAIFALNPHHMALDREDQHGFRVLAERSMLADAVKDPGATTMFPDLPLAEHWKRQAEAQRGWEHFQLADFERLRRDWGVSWVVVDQPNVAGLDCLYANRTLRVCRVPPGAFESHE